MERPESLLNGMAGDEMNIYCPFAIWCELWTPFLTDRLKDMQRDNTDLRIENSRLRAKMIEEGKRGY